MNRFSKVRVFWLVAVAASIWFFAIDSNAQSKKRKTSSTKIATIQTAPAPTTDPEIISRADDYTLDVPQISPAVETTMRAVDETNAATEKLISDLQERIRILETNKKDDYDVKQKRLALNLDILTKAEQRAESLRKQSFDLMERETAIKTKLEQIDNDLRPENLDRSLAFVGSLRPEEMKAARKKSLEAEKTIQQNLLDQVQKTRAALDINVQKADQLVERLRVKLEADIDSALDDNPQQP